jgi:hypothetical protein
MNWDAIGAIAELLGAVGVIATLAYLGIQIRQNTVSTRTSSYQAAIATTIEAIMRMGLDSDAARILTSGSADSATLSTEEQTRYAMLTSGIFRNFENIFYQHKQGAIDDLLWSGWSSRMRTTFAQPGVHVWWLEYRAGFAKDFAAHLESAPAVAPSVGADLESAAQQSAPTDSA